jgi:hypothetical protein
MLRAGKGLTPVYLFQLIFVGKPSASAFRNGQRGKPASLFSSRGLLEVQDSEGCLDALNTMYLLGK